MTDLEKTNANLLQSKIRSKKEDILMELEINTSESPQSEENQEIEKLVFGYLCYPDSNLASVHREAHCLGNYDIQRDSNDFIETSDDEQFKLCPCCGFKRQKFEIKLCTPFEDISNFGTSTYLFFKTFKHLAVLLLIMAIVYSGFALVTNIISSKSSSTVLASDYLVIALSAKQQSPTDENILFYYIQCWIGLGMVVICFVAFIVLRYYDIKEVMDYDSETNSASDLSIVMSGVPVEITKEEIQKSLNAYYELVKGSAKLKSPFEIAKLNVALPISLNEDTLKDEQLDQINKDIAQVKEELIKLVKERQSSHSFSTPKTVRQQLYVKYEKLNEERGKKMLQIGKKVKQSLKEKRTEQMTSAFVTFKSSLSRIALCQLNRNDIYSKIKYLLSCCSDSNRLHIKYGADQIALVEIERAPQPEDIVWSNIGTSFSQLVFRKLFTFTCTIIILGASFTIVYGLSLAQQNYGTDRYLSIAISVFISVVNIIFGLIIQYLTAFERDYTETNHQASLAVKSIFAQLINSILIPLIVSRFIQENIYSVGGLADNIFMLGLTNSLVSPILKIFNIGYFVGRLLAWWNKRPASKLYTNQKRLNINQEKMLFQIGYQYIYVVNLFLFVCFYISLQPVIAIFAVFGYLIMYWAQKYSLFNRSKRPTPGTDLVHKAVYQMIYIGPLLYSLGSLTWSNFFPEGSPKYALIPNLIAVGVSISILLVPSGFIFSLLMEKIDASKETFFESERIYFSSEYDRLNPHTFESGIKDYNEYLDKKKKEIEALSKSDQEAFHKKRTINMQRGAQGFARAVGGNGLQNFLNQNVMLNSMVLNQMASPMAPQMAPQMAFVPQPQQPQQNYRPQQNAAPQFNAPYNAQYQPQVFQAPQMQPSYGMSQFAPVQVGYGNSFNQQFGGFNPTSMFNPNMQAGNMGFGGYGGNMGGYGGNMGGFGGFGGY